MVNFLRATAYQGPTLFLELHVVGKKRKAEERVRLLEINYNTVDTTRRIHFILFRIVHTLLRFHSVFMRLAGSLSLAFLFVTADVAVSFVYHLPPRIWPSSLQ